ncbi:MAG: hypothetical protein HYX68_14295 [Planctomycetes bacterium]|jgi:hypothetical protein|nr:hypothetical protein [Planctomycetota bacterium]
MIECPYCYRVFRQPPEKLGARCPKCKMPLYEDPAKRKKNPEKDYGPCVQHPEAQSVARCSRCDTPMCQTCRTRWHEEPVCPRCVDESIADDEPSPREAQLQTKHAWTGVILAFTGWMLLLLTLAPLSMFNPGPVKPIILFSTYFLALGSFLPAIFGLGYAASAIRLRGDHGKLATIGLASAGSQLGLALGIFVLNVWHN